MNKIDFTIYPLYEVRISIQEQINQSKAAEGIYIMKIHFADGSTATQRIIKRN